MLIQISLILTCYLSKSVVCQWWLFNQYCLCQLHCLNVIFQKATLNISYWYSSMTYITLKAYSQLNWHAQLCIAVVFYYWYYLVVTQPRLLSLTALVSAEHISRLTVLSQEAKEEAACAPTQLDSWLTTNKDFTASRVLIFKKPYLAIF